MKYNYLSDVYKDFFGTNYDINNVTVEENNKEINVVEELNGLLLDDDSIKLLEKIIGYIKNYNKDNNYLSFNLLIESNNKELNNKINNLLIKIVSNYNYLDNNNYKEISLFELNDFNQLKEILTSTSIIIFKDLNALDLKDNDYKKTLLYLLKEYALNKNIIIIYGSKNELNKLLELDNLLQNKFFPFRLISKNPDILDIYQEVLDITKVNDEEFKVKLLDYITNTFKTSSLDYITYRDNLCREITFNNKLPDIEVTKSIEEIFSELNELVGLENVKKTLHELVDLISLKQKTDLKIDNVNLHMVFLGNPGTGKTTVARIIANILYNLKYIKQNKLIEVTSKDLVAEYVGQTAPKTNAVVERAMGGVLFIDEAYALASKGSANTYNDEAIATLIKAMEDNRNNLVVIFAGYTKEMQAFLDSNSGIVSRIGYTLEFADYTVDELIQIFKNMVNKSGFIIEAAAIDKLKEIIEENKQKENFGNARFVRNVYEKTVIKHAANTKDKKKKIILKTITKEDISIEGLL